MCFVNKLDSRAAIKPANPASRRANKMIEIIMQQGRQANLRLEREDIMCCNDE